MRKTMRAADAQAEHDAWSRTAEIMEHFVAAANLSGIPELKRAMEKAEAEALREVNRTMDALEAGEE